VGRSGEFGDWSSCDSKYYSEGASREGVANVVKHYKNEKIMMILLYLLFLVCILL